MLQFPFFSVDMKPQDLKSPFIWKNRNVLVEDRIWYVPSQMEDYTSFAFPGWNSLQFFENDNPVSIEYCSGNGTWIASKAEACPEHNWVAIERKFERIRKIWSKIKNFALPNLMAICGEGYAATHHFFPTNSVQDVYINFPDPWPKTRHGKHRLIQVPFIQELERIMRPGGTLTMVTDDAAHSAWMMKVMQHFPRFESVFAAPYYTEEYPEYGTSFFEDLWRGKGKKIRYHAFRKV